jgi:hypothetical protein
MAHWIRHRPADPGTGLLLARRARAERANIAKRVATLGFEPTPSWTGASSPRLRPHLLTAVVADASVEKDNEKTSLGKETPKRRQRE